MTASNDGKQGMFIHGGALGDFVLSLRIVAALRTMTPRITVVARCGLAPTLMGSMGIEQVLDMETSGFHVLFSDAIKREDLPPESLPTHEWAINMLPGNRLSDNLGLMGIKTVIDLDPRPMPGDTRHITDQWLAALAPSGFSPETPMSGLPVSREDLRHARKALRRGVRDATGPIGVVHPGSGGKRKCWPKMLELAERIAAEHAGVVCLLGPVEAESMPRDVKLTWAEKFTIITSPMEGLAPLMAAADFFVGNDAGVAHVAAAAGTHTLTIFGPTDPRVWAPIGPRTAIAAPRAGEAWPTVDAALEILLTLGSNDLDRSGPIDIVPP